MQRSYIICLLLATFTISILLPSCSKQQQEIYPINRVLDIQVSGYIAKDSLQFKLGDNVIKPNAAEPGLYFSGAISTQQVSNGPTTFSISNGKGELILERKFDGSVLSNEIKFYYDGASIIDNLPDIPKPAPGNVGLLINFPERKYTKVPLKDIAVEVSAMKRGKPSIKKLYNFNEDGTIFADTEFPAGYSYITIILVKASNPSERYVTGVTTSISLTSPNTDKGYLMLIQEVNDMAGTFAGIQGIELTQYLQ